MSMCHSSRLSDLAIEIPGGTCSFNYACRASVRLDPVRGKGVEVVKERKWKGK